MKLRALSDRQPEAPRAALLGDLLYSDRVRLPVPAVPEPSSARIPKAEEIRSGSETAFDALFSALYPRLCGYVTRLVASPDLAEELVQEVFTDIWKRRRAWEPKGTAEQYLFRAARNRALKHLRHQEVRDRMRGEVATTTHRRPATPEEVLALDEISGAAQDAIDGLPERCRHIFLLSREGALTYREISEQLDISVKTVETQMARALKVIRRALLPYLR